MIVAPSCPRADVENGIDEVSLRVVVSPAQGVIDTEVSVSISSTSRRSPFEVVVLDHGPQHVERRGHLHDRLVK